MNMQNAMRDAHFHPDPVNNLPKPNDNNHLALERNGKVFEIEELSLSSLIDVLIILRISFQVPRIFIRETS
jgi:hypothetical protein